LPSFRRVLSVRLIVIGTIIEILPFFTLLLFKALMILAPIFYSAACISVADDVAQMSVIPISSLAAFLRLSETASRVPVGTLPAVMLITSSFIFTVECQVNQGCCVQHCLEALYVCIDFFIVFWKVGVRGGVGELIDDHP
jgi:hypothetical protein